jgi:hypothetical protein
VVSTSSTNEKIGKLEQNEGFLVVGHTFEIGKLEQNEGFLVVGHTFEFDY